MFTVIFIDIRSIIILVLCKTPYTAGDKIRPLSFGLFSVVM